MKNIICLSVWMVMLGISYQLMAQKSSFQGVYLSLAVPYQNTQGDLNGNSVLVTSSEVFLVPQVDGGIGLGIGIGIRSGLHALELNYNRTIHAITFTGAEGKAVLRAVSMDYKYYFNRDAAVQPYIQLGWLPGFSLKVYDASASISNSGDVRDARIVGSIGTVQAGLGMGFFIIPRLSINGGVTYRNGNYTGVVGGKDIAAAHIEEPLQGNGLNAMLSVSLLVFRNKN